MTTKELPAARKGSQYRNVRFCQHPGCKGWANRSGLCPVHGGKNAKQGGRDVVAR